MTVENLYRAIGNMDDKYLEDLIKSETDIYNAAHSLDSSLYEERTIEVSVVRKKKRTISIILAAALLIGSVAAAAVFMGTKKDKKEYTTNVIYWMVALQLTSDPSVHDKPHHEYEDLTLNTHQNSIPLLVQCIRNLM